MRKFAFIFIALLAFEAALQATNPIEGKQLTVVANSGLILRSNPNLNSEAVEVIPFGEKVKVINASDVTTKSERIEWVDGNWIYVEYEGQKGYVFDGYLVPFNLPKFDFEFCNYDFNLTYPLEAWTDYHLEHIAAPDTTINEEGYGKVVHQLEDGQRMIEENMEHYHRLNVYLTDLRVMDAYHLLLSMIESKIGKEEIRNQSIFVENKEGKITRVSINLDNPVSISQTRQGQVKVSVLTPNEGCKLSI